MLGIIEEQGAAPLGSSVPQLARRSGIGRTKIFEAIAAGELKARKLGSRTIILEEDAIEYLRSLPPARGLGTERPAGRKAA